MKSRLAARVVGPADKVNANAKSSQLTRQTLSLKNAMTAFLSLIYRTLATNLLVAPGGMSKIHSSSRKMSTNHPGTQAAR